MRNENRTIVISSHQLADLERFADHVAVMQAGQIITYGAIPDLLERYVQLDVQLPRNATVQSSAIRAISRQQDRARVLLDRWTPQRQSLEALGAEVISESPLTLEELFVALMKTGRSRWQPKMSAA
jgi:ABC-2 type transport system ATP-binding protein